MTAREIYEKETGNICPTNQIAYNEWHIEYVKWLEKEVESKVIFVLTEEDIKNSTQMNCIVVSKEKNVW